MNLHTRALYNLIRLNSLEENKGGIEKWQTEDFRMLSSKQIFTRLKDLQVSLDKSSFFHYASSCDTPESLAELILPENLNVQMYDHAYLLLFELWRRFSPEKQSLSIFGDELDYRIYQYDHNLLESDEQIQDALANLREILDKNTDAGVKPQDAFLSITIYCAHDLEEFLYDYISEQIEANNYTYAQELIEGFSPYMQEILWFEFLQIKVDKEEDIALINEKLEKLRKDLKKEPNLELQMEILSFMVEIGDRDLFIKLARQTLDVIEQEEDFLDLMQVVAEFYRRLDLEDMEQSVQKIMQMRHKKKLDEKINLKDPDIAQFKLALH